MIEHEEVELMVCPFCLEWGPPTDSGFCANCKPPVRHKVDGFRVKMRLKHCPQCGKPYYARGPGRHRCPECRNRCKWCGEPCERPPGKPWGRNISCPRCISIQRSISASKRKVERTPKLVTCSYPGCDVVIVLLKRKRNRVRYCEQHSVEARRERALSMPRNNGTFVKRS